MSKVIRGADGKRYKQVTPTNVNRKRTPEIVLSAISLLLSVVLIGSGLGVASFADAWGGGGYYTGKFLIGILLAIVAFALTFLINKHHTLNSWLIIIIGVFILLACGVYGILGGIFFIATGIVALVRK
ncbi:hypothetical protein [Liquorilactobacillus satsumensis]|uniref:hypothetical protein n=1 Tax=Liquorilactobacillus TaxID=2767888 RepID=UPI001E3D9606|nr:hypothetical protein [Liquorilactobacillus satsumensis]MCC7667475.1 hypothetical protein [Liquorilactobacillus satsumensis]MCP9357937.1 hypothetical protein [Liquorilactobacillus satsumensis]MCP9371635.1 hypothetical protein [Liquorilactobacillus satsumensis]